jgi:hypothetical protein
MHLLQAIPILAFLEKETTRSFYQSLGFTCHGDWEGYLIFARDAVEIHLWQCDDASIPRNTGCYVRVSDIMALYEQCIELGCVHPNGELELKHWGMRQFSILDNNGNILHFGTPVTPA